MKVFISFFIIALLAPLIKLYAQSNKNVNCLTSFTQYYFVHIVSGYGIIPATSILVIDKDGQSISCKALPGPEVINTCLRSG